MAICNLNCDLEMRALIHRIKSLRAGNFKGSVQLHFDGSGKAPKTVEVPAPKTAVDLVREYVEETGEKG